MPDTTTLNKTLKVHSPKKKILCALNEHPPAIPKS